MSFSVSGPDTCSRDSPKVEDPDDGFVESMATSVWGDMMREAVDREDV